MISQHQVDLPVVSSINIDRASSVEDVLMIGSYFVSFFIMFLMSLG